MFMTGGNPAFDPNVVEVETVDFGPDGITRSTERVPRSDFLATWAPTSPDDFPHVATAVPIEENAVTLTEFLLARIAEDKAEAKAAGQVESSQWWVDGPAQVSGKHWVYATGEKFERREVADHIARHDPARVLAECEAKRRIVGWHGFGHECPDDGTVAGLAPAGWYGESSDECPTLLALAMPYADHPDYDEAWKP